MSAPRGKTSWPDRPRSIPDNVYGLGTAKVTFPEHPIPVRAWIEYIGGKWEQLDGDVVAYTQKACRFRYIDTAGNVESAWIWANAVIGRR